MHFEDPSVKKSIHCLKSFSVIALALLLAACAGTPPDIFVPHQMPPPLVMKKPPQVALVLGAGGARGYAHAGALYVLHRAGVPVDLIAGASAGSLIGALYADSTDPLKVSNVMLQAGFWSFADIANTPSVSGIIQGYHFQKFLLKNMRARNFNELKIPLIVAVTDLDTGKTLSISNGPITPAVNASAAVPGVVEPVNMYGYRFIDGGVADPVPVDLVLKYHPKVIIAINIAVQLSKKIPRAALGIYNRSTDMSWLALCKLTERNSTYVIRPQVGQVGTFEISQRWKVFQEGESAARADLPAILAMLKKNNIPLLPKSER